MSDDAIILLAGAQETNQHDDQQRNITRHGYGEGVPALKGVFEDAGRSCGRPCGVNLPSINTVLVRHSQIQEIESRNPTVATPVKVINDEKSATLTAVTITGIHSPYIRNPMLVKHVAIVTAATKRLGLQMAILIFSKSLEFRYR